MVTPVFTPLLGLPRCAKPPSFDAECYRVIFNEEYPDTDFLSIGNEFEVRTDRLQIGQAIQTLVSGTAILRVVDRDNRTSDEIEALGRSGVNVLSKRSLESYLLDDEVLSRLCEAQGQSEKLHTLLTAKQQATKVSQIENRFPRRRIRLPD